MTHRTITEPRYEYGCDRCGVTEETDGMYPSEWTSVTFNAGGAMRTPNGSTLYRLYCPDCAPVVLDELFKEPAAQAREGTVS